MTSRTCVSDSSRVQATKAQPPEAAARNFTSVPRKYGSSDHSQAAEFVVKVMQHP